MSSSNISGNRRFLMVMAALLVGWILLLSWAVAEPSEYNRDGTRVSIDDHSVRNVNKSIDVASESVSESASSSAASNGDQVSMNSSQFYALSLMFPNATDCFTGIQGGAQDSSANNGTSGFLGLHLLNKSCWLQRQASAEQDIELNARLRCGDKHYRNAIAYDTPKKQRQAVCIEKKIGSAREQMDNYKSEMNKLIEQQDLAAERLEACGDRIDAANERTERCFDSLTSGEK
jgi:hypothetical protein